MKTLKIIIVLVICCYFNAAMAQNDTKNATAENSSTDGRISLRLAGNGSYITILLGFIPEGTNGFDEGYDSYFINDGAVIEFFSMLSTTRLSIQALPELTTTNVTVALGYEVLIRDIYTISIDAEFINPDFEIILEDTLLNTFTDLRLAAYSFAADLGENHNRFRLNFNNRNALSIPNANASEQNIRTFFAEEMLHIQTERDDLQELSLYSLNGKQILHAKFTKKLPVNYLKTGIYLLQLTTNSGQKIIKKVLKNSK